MKKILSLVCLCVLASPAAMAAGEDNSPWFAASLGMSVVQDDENLAEDQDRAITLGLGWDHNDFLASEFDYVDFGGFDGDIDGVEFSGRAVTASVVPYYQVDRMRLFARAGAQYWSARLKAPSVSTEERKGFDPLFGLGVEYHLGRANTDWSLRADWNRYFTVGDKNTTGESDIDTFNIGFVFRK